MGAQRASERRHCVAHHGVERHVLRCRVTGTVDRGREADAVGELHERFAGAGVDRVEHEIRAKARRKATALGQRVEGDNAGAECLAGEDATGAHRP